MFVHLCFKQAQPKCVTLLKLMTELNIFRYATISISDDRDLLNDTFIDWKFTVPQIPQIPQIRKWSHPGRLRPWLYTRRGP